jgi:formamidopyrimidine-DNA glycosylase
VAADADWPPRFQKLSLTFEDGSQLAFCDPRRFGKFKLVEGGGAASSTVKELGFDPLTDMPDLEEFIQLIKKRAKGATRLKPLLLDQVGWAVLWGRWRHGHAAGSSLQLLHTYLHTPSKACSCSHTQ